MARRFVRGTREMAGESAYSFPWRGGGGENAKKRKYYLDVSMARKNFKTCDKNLILYLQKGTMDLFRSVILLRFHPLLSKVLKIYLKIEFLHSSILRGFEAVLKN